MNAACPFQKVLHGLAAATEKAHSVMTRVQNIAVYILPHNGTPFNILLYLFIISKKRANAHWRERVGIEPTLPVLAGNTGFDVRGGHEPYALPWLYYVIWRFIANPRGRMHTREILSESDRIDGVQKIA